MGDEHDDGIDVADLRFDLLTLAIDYHAKSGEHFDVDKVIITAKKFENYLINEPPLDQIDQGNNNDKRSLN